MISFLPAGGRGFTCTSSCPVVGKQSVRGGGSSTREAENEENVRSDARKVIKRRSAGFSEGLYSFRVCLSCLRCTR